MATSDEATHRSLANRPVILSICLDLTRSHKREKALVAAGFRVVSATTFQCARAMEEHCKFFIVVLDQECCSELASVRLVPPYLIIGTESGVDESSLAQRLSNWCQFEVPKREVEAA
jgi:hypothetical protein